MKFKWIYFITLTASLLPLTSPALLVSRSYSHTTSDNDNHVDEDASRTTTTIGATSATLSDVGNASGNMGYRFAGQAESKVSQDIIQTINGTVTWTVTAEDWEEYSILLTPELHAYLNIEDNGADASGDSVSFSTLNAILRVNGGSVGDSLDMSGYTKTLAGSYNLDRTDSQTLSGYTGNNTFSLQYTGTLRATSAGGLNYTGNVGLWGSDGTLGGEIGIATDWDEYSSTTAVATNDGLFVDANVTLDAIPEPATLGLVGLFSGGLFFIRRIFRI